MASTGLVAVLAGTLAMATGPGAVAAEMSTGTVRGTVWHDLDGDGVREAGEPGLAKVVVTRLGTSERAVTGADGTWRMTVPAGTVTLTAITGWLPSACPGDLWCAAGRARDQDFAVENQFLKARPAVAAGSTVSGVDLGLSPDHGDPTGASTSRHSGNDPGDGAARSHDLAVRHSGEGYTGCSDPTGLRVCPVGTTIGGLGQLYNQGTAWVSGVRFVVTVPRGATLATDPVLDQATPGTRPTRTGRTGTTASGGTWIEFSVDPIPPGGAVWFRSAVRQSAGPSTPKPYPSGHDRRSFIAISALTPRDVDSTLRTDPELGLDAGHNVNHLRSRDDDTSDAIEWNVA